MLIQNIDSSQPPAAPASAGIAVAGGMSPEQAQQLPAAQPVREAAPPKKDPPAKEVAHAVEQANRAMAALSTAVQFYIDPDTKITVVKIVDTAHNEVLRQVPAQEMLDIARALSRVQGLLLHTEA